MPRFRYAIVKTFKKLLLSSLNGQKRLHYFPEGKLMYSKVSVILKVFGGGGHIGLKTYKLPTEFYLLTMLSCSINMAKPWQKTICWGISTWSGMRNTPSFVPCFQHFLSQGESVGKPEELQDAQLLSSQCPIAQFDSWLYLGSFTEKVRGSLLILVPYLQPANAISHFT